MKHKCSGAYFDLFLATTVADLVGVPGGLCLGSTGRLAFKVFLPEASEGVALFRKHKGRQKAEIKGREEGKHCNKRLLC